MQENLISTFPDGFGGGVPEIISVIIPVYNCAEFLQECINSVLNQTYNFLQLILIDDGSTDDSGKICDQYAAYDSRVLVIHKKNGGVSSARNVGLRAATGEYLGFVDSDDWIEPEMYEQLLKTLKAQNVECVMCEHINFKDDRTSKGVRFVGDRREIDDEYACAGICISIGKNEFTDVKYFYLWDKLYRRNTWGNLCFDENLINGEDRWTLFQLYGKIKRIGLCYKELYHYRVHEGISSNKNRNRDSDYIVGYRMLAEIQKGNRDISPYQETCVMHTLGMVQNAMLTRNKSKYMVTQREFKKLYPSAKQRICHAKPEYRMICYLLRYMPKTLWVIGIMFLRL